MLHSALISIHAANDVSIAGSSLTFIHPGFRLSNALYASITEVIGSR